MMFSRARGTEHATPAFLPRCVVVQAISATMVVRHPGG
jgi:hypothetical protein